MRTKLLIGSAMAAALMSVGVLTGSIVGASSTSAQTPSATPTPSTTNPTSPTTPPTGAPYGMPGMRGGGLGMHGGPGDFDGPRGQAATADGASRAITNATNLINLVKSDLAYAHGKMDTTDVQRWVSGADSLLT